uniref:Major facilitator superfamily (MFS) profile domain-containing protein n=1 Tax=Moniliophthora roreri TaxID=221103 RepID=A0A0W0F328_MONRR
MSSDATGSGPIGNPIPLEENHAGRARSNNSVLESLQTLRLQSLDTVNNAPFSWRSHGKVCAVTGAGFFTDSYSLFAISAASIMIGQAYPSHSEPIETCPSVLTLQSSYDLGLKASSSIGTIFGALIFGWLGDKLGRRRMYGAELLIIVVATLGQAVSGQAKAINIIGVLIMWRFLGGIGIGGDYPSSAIIASEFSPTQFRGRMMNSVFASQGWGTLTAAIVTLIIISAFKDSINTTSDSSVDFMWRILIGFGCVPGILTLSSRIAITETPRYTMDIERDVQQAALDVAYLLSRDRPASPEDDTVTRRAGLPKSGWRDFRGYFSNSENLKMLFGVSYSWFALDVTYYGLGLNSGRILQAVGFGCDQSSSSTGEIVYNSLRNICFGNLILLTGLIPGYWVCFLVIDKFGRKPIQLMGFVVLTGLFIIMGFAFEKLSPNALLGLYCLANFFSNFGPNTTTFIIPAEAFPTRYRSTAYGIAAASGKLGSIITQIGFSKIDNLGHIFKIFTAFTLTGFIVTYNNILETKDKSLEELSNEDL